MNEQIFRTYDIRGIVDEDLTASVVYDVGRAFGTYVQRTGSKEVLVGHDNRDHSPRLREKLVEGLMSTGAEVVDIGEVATPVFYYARHLFCIDGGVMITGSHNPPEYNGFKLAQGEGTLYGSEIQKLRQMIERGDFTFGDGGVKSASADEKYLQMLEDKVTLENVQKRPLRVVVDCGNGSASNFAPEAIKRWGAQVIPLYCDSDPSFPNHHPDPVKVENLRDLRETVLNEEADLGVAYDGDADRLGVIDDKGNIVWGDDLMILFWREILPQYPDTPVIVEVKCSQALVDEVERLGGEPMFYKTGHSLIKAKMREIDAVFTGEMSGHMFFADEYFGFDDAIYATGRLLRILDRQGKPLSELLADVPVYYSTAETRIDCPEEDKYTAVNRLQAHFRERAERESDIREVIDVDGARVIFENGWGLVRASNTSPKLVSRCESTSEEGLEKIKEIMFEALVEVGGVDPFPWA